MLDGSGVKAMPGSIPAPNPGPIEKTENQHSTYRFMNADPESIKRY